MKQRIIPYMIFGSAFALLFIGLATALQASSNSAQGWMDAQARTPILWLVDACALLTILMMTHTGAVRARIRQQAMDVQRLREEQTRQLEALITRSEALENRNTELEDRNEEYAAKITSLEAASQERQAAYEADVYRLNEQAFLAVQAQVEAQARQLEAVNMALRYQRAEIRQARHGVHSLQSISDVAQIARLSPAELAAIHSHTPLQEEEAEESEDRSGAYGLDMTLNANSTLILETLDYEVTPALMLVDSVQDNLSASDEERTLAATIGEAVVSLPATDEEEAAPVLSPDARSRQAMG